MSYQITNSECLGHANALLPTSSDAARRLALMRMRVELLILELEADMHPTTQQLNDQELV